MLKLYHSPNSCSLASHLTLEHVGAEYDLVRVDFTANEQRSPAYLKVNPKGRVPALVTSSGEQSVVMLSLEDFQALEDTAYLLRNPANAKRLLTAVGQLNAGKGVARPLAK